MMGMKNPLKKAVKISLSQCAFLAFLAGAALTVIAAQDSPPTAADCAAPITQKLMNECAFEDFLLANIDYTDSSQVVFAKLAGKSRDLFRRSQISWISHRTEQCDFESSGVLGSSREGMIKWQCAARMTRARIVELAKLADCGEGNLGCLRFRNNPTIR